MTKRFQPPFVLSILLLSLVFTQKIWAATLVLEGDMHTSVEVIQEQTFSVPSTGLKKLVFRFALPASSSNITVKQTVGQHTLKYYPLPTDIREEVDRFGNLFKLVTWIELKDDVTIKGGFRTDIDISLRKKKSSAPFPVSSGGGRESAFAKATPLTQSLDPGIVSLSKKLVGNVSSEQSAVMNILNWVVDNVKYRTPVSHYDAVWTLENRIGNCQNFSHLSIALLRASGIPARIVGGIALGKSWRVPLKDGYLVQSIGQGGHAWVEVFYPDIGWVAYDTQQSHLFVSPRHIRQTVGMDSLDINDTWRSAPVLPRFRETFSAKYIRDSMSLSLVDTVEGPENYIISNSVIPVALLKPVPLPPLKPMPLPEPPVKGRVVEFGNIYFPDLTGLYNYGEGDKIGYKTLDKETAEYVTTKYSYAQAFTIENTLSLHAISLAMHKFGGRLGSLWVDVVKDNNGKPGMEGLRSFPLNLDTVRRKPGYQWFKFTFSRDGSTHPLLEHGKYWIILRKSEDAVVNWFYIPSNPYDGADDTRSTSRGIRWSNVLNYDFNFKVRGAYE